MNTAAKPPNNSRLQLAFVLFCAFLLGAVRKDSPLLLQTLNEFHKKEYRRLVYNTIYNRYFKDSRRIQSYQANRISGSNGHFSPYDQLVKQYAKDYLFDWRLIVAQMYQEVSLIPTLHLGLAHKA